MTNLIRTVVLRPKTRLSTRTFPTVVTKSGMTPAAEFDEEGG